MDKHNYFFDSRCQICSSSGLKRSSGDVSVTFKIIVPTDALTLLLFDPYHGAWAIYILRCFSIGVNSWIEVE